MSWHTLATGVLASPPQRRQGAKALFATASLRINAGSGETAFLSLIAFNESAERLLEFGAGDALSVSGPTRPTSWTNSDGEERRGISVTGEQIASLKPPAAPQRSRAPAPRRQIPYPRPRLARTSAPNLPADDVSDIFADGLVP